VGHSIVKAAMAANDGCLGGERSSHYYFRDFWYADSGLLATLHIMAIMASGSGPLSSMTAEFARYTASGERRDEVPHGAAVGDRLPDLGALCTDRPRPHRAD
jgi:phosphomannomutase